MNNQSNHFGDQRQIIDTNTAKYDIYDFGGPVLEGVHQLDLSYDRKTGHGAYMIRMEPGTETISHVHSLREEYLILEGDVVESDGTVLGPGDYVIYEPGDDKFVMTTWHENEPLKDVYFFSKNNAAHSVVEIDNTLLLHISRCNMEKEFLVDYESA